MGNTIFEKLTEKYPFITLCLHATVEYVGIVQNKDDFVTTIYDFSALLTPEDRVEFLELANIWWWESNRSIPINIFLRNDWAKFKPTLRTFINKDLQILHGPVCSLIDIARKKIKRRSITLVRKIN
jgi:hypothetical protein